LKGLLFKIFHLLSIFTNFAPIKPIFFNMNITIRAATTADMSAIHGLVYELAVFELAPEAHTATVADYTRDFEAGIFEAHVAETETNEVVGMIFYFMTYSTWRGRMLYLEDFYVKEAYRRLGLGQHLFDKFLEIAKAKDCVLVKWQVLDWNEPAISFYEKNHATIEKEWYNGKIFVKKV
jgi:GNAT superfamily N-acetyltransferase